jgi:hypothetical protein
MPSADDPNIKIEYSNDVFPPSNWVELQSYATEFRVRDAGILKSPSVNVFLHNYRGRFSNVNSDLYLKDYKIVRIRANIRNSTWDTIFYGRIYSKRDPITGAYYKGGFGAGFGSGFQHGDGGLRSTIEVMCRDIGAQKLLDLTKSQPKDQGYKSAGNLCNDAIIDFLVHPDDMLDSNIILETDTGIIETTVFPRDANKDTLLDLLQSAGEEIGYDGYSYINSSNQLKLHFYPIGTEETNPQIFLQEPFVSIEPNYDIDDVKNIIFVWGSTDAGFPPIDLWCEQGVNRFPNSWTGYDANTTVADDSTYYVGDDGFQYAYGAYSIKVKRINSGGTPWAIFNISASGYIRPQDRTKTTINLTDDRFSAFTCDVRPHEQAGDFIICLVNPDGKKAQRTHATHPAGQWSTITLSVLNADHDDWTVDSGFDWSNIEKIWIVSGVTYYADYYFNLDGMRFTANGWKIDPILHPSYNPCAFDELSITNYGRRIHHHENDKINCFEYAYGEGQKVLNMKKHILKKITVTKSAYTWAKPQQYLRLYLPEHNIGYTEKWRIVEIEHNWSTKTKVLRTTFSLVKRPDIYDSLAMQSYELSGLLKTIKK